MSPNWKHPLSARRWWSCLALILAWLPFAAAWAGSGGKLPSVAFYYGPNPPVSALQSFDWIVVDGNAQLPPRVSGIGPGHPGPTWFAYLSVGEVGNGDADRNTLAPSCLIGDNPAWHSRILDMRRAACRQWLLQYRVQPLIQRGFTHFFLDTLDSNRRVLDSPAQQQAYDRGIVALVRAIRQRLPRARFMLNRGFDLLDALKGDGVIAVAAESLYRGWDQAHQRYVPVKPADSAWLKARMQEVKKRSLVPIVIDYVADGHPREARRDAGHIRADGFVPYITNGQLDRVGTGTITPQPRHILMLYNGDSSPLQTNANWFAAMPLNHMGYATRTLDVDTQALPTDPLNRRIAGIVTWFSGDELKHPEQLYTWLRKQMQAGIPVAILGDFGFPADATHLKPLGLEPGDAPADGMQPISVQHQDSALTGFEIAVHPAPGTFSPLRLEQGHAVLTLKQGTQTTTVTAITPWGGYALSPYVITSLPQGALASGQLQSRWILNPFAFLRKALRLQPIPAFDTTTLSGNRLLFAQIDGDGFASASYIGAYRQQPAAQVILEAVLKHYHLPVAASLIAGEFVDGGLHDAAELAKLRPIARAILALPWVEIGSHSYSHPFDWHALESNPDLSAGLHIPEHGKGKDNLYEAVKGLKYGYNLPIPGYRFNLRTEVGGSVRIIDKLAPANKSVVLYQWPGDTDPGARAVGMTYADGLLNINGGNSTISAQWPSLTNVPGVGAWKGPHFQVYAPDANEDQFTHDWSPPYCAYRKVLQTFRMTEAPRRLDPVDIYYHFYSGARPCALDALRSVYDWAQKQPFTPIFASHYARIALGFEYAGIARKGAGYTLGGYGADQTVRIPASMGYPELSRSRNIAGFNDANHSRYITLGPGGRAYLVLDDKPPAQPYLVTANAPLQALERSPGHVAFTFRGHVPLRVTLAHAEGCRIRFRGQPATSHLHDGKRTFASAHESGRLDLRCHTR